MVILHLFVMGKLAQSRKLGVKPVDHKKEVNVMRHVWLTCTNHDQYVGLNMVGLSCIIMEKLT